MTRGSSLSDEKVIETVGRDFVAVEINITESGFPQEAPALKLWEKAFAKDRRYRFGFATSVVIGPGGSMPFGTSGCGHSGEWEISANYHPDRYLKFLEESFGRYQKAKGVAEDRSLSADDRSAKLKNLTSEVVRAIQEAAKCRKSE